MCRPENVRLALHACTSRSPPHKPSPAEKVAAEWLTDEEKTERLVLPLRLPSSLRTHHSTHRILFRFFAKKTEPKNASTVFRYAETGECLRTPSGRSPYFRCAEVGGAFVPLRCPSIRAAVCDTLPLRPVDEMGIYLGRPIPSRTNAIGHRWM